MESDIVISNVMNVLEDEESMEKLLDMCVKKSLKAKDQKILAACIMAKVSYDDYLKALSASNHGYSVVYERDIDELFSNPYNIEWMQAWDGNLDLQPCLDTLLSVPTLRTIMQNLTLP